MSAVVEQMPEPKPRGRALAVSAPTGLDIVQAALKSGNVEIYKEAVALAKELKAIAAREAFDNAMSDAKAKIPPIRKNRRVHFDSKSGGTSTDYMHEDLAEIARTVDPILSDFGLSYRFRVASPLNEPVSVTCVVSHRAGYFEETTLTAGRDDDKSSKNAIQRIGSTITYLQRYTLKAALGLAVSHDDDGRASQQEAEPEAYTPPAGAISRAQVEELRLALEAKGANEKAFLQWAKRKRMDDIPAEHFEACKTAIAKFRKV